jgi:hypothetical protein
LWRRHGLRCVSVEQVEDDAKQRSPLCPKCATAVLAGLGLRARRRLYISSDL